MVEPVDISTLTDDEKRAMLRKVLSEIPALQAKLATQVEIKQKLEERTTYFMRRLSKRGVSIHYFFERFVRFEKLFDQFMIDKSEMTAHEIKAMILAIKAGLGEELAQVAKDEETIYGQAVGLSVPHAAEQGAGGEPDEDGRRPDPGTPGADSGPQ